MNIVFALTGVASATDLADGAGASLLQFATEHGVNLKGMNAIGDLTGVTGTALGNKMVDILYKMNPSQWGDLAGAFPNAADVIHENYKSGMADPDSGRSEPVPEHEADDEHEPVFRRG